MKASQFSDVQKAFILKQGADGMPVADVWALAEMLRTGWFTDVHVKSEDTHRLKMLLGARDQLVKVKRSLGN